MAALQKEEKENSTGVKVNEILKQILNKLPRTRNQTLETGTLYHKQGMFLQKMLISSRIYRIFQISTLIQSLAFR